MGKLILMCEVHNAEIFRPLAGSAKEKDYLASELDKIEDFFNSHQDLYEYYQEASDAIDIKLFVREVEERFYFRDLPIEIDPVFLYGDPAFSTGFDY